MKRNCNCLLFAVQIKAETEGEQGIFDKVETFYLAIYPAFRPPFSRKRYVNEQETLFYFTFKLAHLVLKGTNLINVEFWFMS